MNVEQTAFETHKDFTQLLTDAAMKPETAHSSVSTQKFAFALFKRLGDERIMCCCQNRMKIPNEIEINVDTFNDTTVDGQNENELLERFSTLVSSERDAELATCVMSSFEQFCLYGGIAVGVIGLVMLLFGNKFLGLIAVIAGVGMVLNHFSKKKDIENKRQNIAERYEKKRSSGSEIIRATLAEVVDFRIEFADKDSESEQVIDFLEQLSPDQYVRKLATSNRRVKM